jgi:ketosteroid isomerase-like protein
MCGQSCLGALPQKTFMRDKSQGVPCLEEGGGPGNGRLSSRYTRRWSDKFVENEIFGMLRLISNTRCQDMKKLAALLFVVVAFVLVPQSRAQAPTAAELRELAKEKEVKQEELVNLETESARAIQWNNGTIFRRIYGEDFVGILPTGQAKDKAGWIASIENNNIKYTSFVASDIHVRMFQDTAVVTCLWSSRGTQNGRAFSRQYRVTHVYIYGQRGWQAVAGQETLLPG